MPYACSPESGVHAWAPFPWKTPYGPVLEYDAADAAMRREQEQARDAAWAQEYRANKMGFTKMPARRLNITARESPHRSQHREL